MLIIKTIDMLDIKIEKGVVATPPIKENQYGDLAEALEIGDSFVVKNQSEKAKFWLGLKRQGLKLMSRTLEDGTVRIWCLGKPRC